MKAAVNLQQIIQTRRRDQIIIKNIRRNSPQHIKLRPQPTTNPPISTPEKRTSPPAPGTSLELHSGQAELDALRTNQTPAAGLDHPDQKNHTQSKIRPPQNLI